MSLHLAQGGADDGEDEIHATINTTPLVDVMLVLLIIFLITVPVVTQSIAVALPQETSVPREVRPQTIEIAVDSGGAVFWNTTPLANPAALSAQLQRVAARVPQPEIHIRGDEAARFEHIGRVLLSCQQAAIRRISFVTEPQAGP